jgi:hypothetical protein
MQSTQSTSLILPLFLPQGQELFRAERAGVAELRHVLDKVAGARASGWIRVAMPGFSGTLLLVRGEPVAATLEQDGQPEPQYGAEAYEASVALLHLGASLVFVRLDERMARVAAGLFAPPSYSRWLTSPLEEAKLALEILGGARFAGAVELLPREHVQTARAIILMLGGRVLGIYDAEAPVPQPSLDGQVATILSQPSCCLRLFPLLDDTPAPLPAPAGLAPPFGIGSGAGFQDPRTAGAPAGAEPGRPQAGPVRPSGPADSGSLRARPGLRRAVTPPPADAPERPAAAPPRIPLGVPLRRSRIGSPGSSAPESSVEPSGPVIDVPRPVESRPVPPSAPSHAPATSASSSTAVVPAVQDASSSEAAGRPRQAISEPGLDSAPPATDPAAAPAPATPLSPMDRALESDVLWLLSALDRSWADVRQKSGSRPQLLEGLAGLVNRALEVAVGAAAARGRSPEDPEELLLRLIPEHRIAAYIPVARGKIDVSPVVKYCRELAAARRPVEPVVADVFACLLQALQDTLEGMLSLADSPALAAQLRDAYQVFIAMLAHERDHLRELAGVPPGSGATALPPSDMASQRFMVLRLRSQLSGVTPP